LKWDDYSFPEVNHDELKKDFQTILVSLQNAIAKEVLGKKRI